MVFGRGVHNFRRSVDHYQPTIALESASDEWGPDAALVPIPDVDAGTIGASALFYDLEQHALGGDTSHLNLSQFQVFALLGVPAAICDLRARPTEFKRTCFFGAKPDAITRFGQSYIDIDLLPSDQFTLPASFGGLSGGSLWGISTSAAEEASTPIANRAVLLGVSYYHLPPRRVRCQGIQDVLFVLSKRAF